MCVLLLRMARVREELQAQKEYSAQLENRLVYTSQLRYLYHKSGLKLLVIQNKVVFGI